MQFQQFAPPAALREYVRYFWALESTPADAGWQTFRTIADGCPGLVYQQAHDGRFRDQTDKPWPVLLLHGQATRAGVAGVQGPFQLVGACLAPGAIRAIFGVKPEELTDACIDAALLPTPDPYLTEQLQQAGSTAAQLDVLAAHLLNRLPTNCPATDTDMQYALAQLVSSQGRVGLRKLREDLRLSERGFQRRFRQYVGVPPKLFSRICQFQGSLRQLRGTGYEKLSDLAFANDYADQSHHIRAFKEFAGVSPRHYQTRSRERAENLLELLF